MINMVILSDLQLECHLLELVTHSKVTLISEVVTHHQDKVRLRELDLFNKLLARLEILLFLLFLLQIHFKIQIFLEIRAQLHNSLQEIELILQTYFKNQVLKVPLRNRQKALETRRKLESKSITRTVVEHLQLKRKNMMENPLIYMDHQQEKKEIGEVLYLIMVKLLSIKEHYYPKKMLEKVVSMEMKMQKKVDVKTIILLLV